MNSENHFEICPKVSSMVFKSFHQLAWTLSNGVWVRPSIDCWNHRRLFLENILVPHKILQVLSSVNIKPLSALVGHRVWVLSAILRFYLVSHLISGNEVWILILILSLPSCVHTIRLLRRDSLAITSLCLLLVRTVINNAGSVSLHTHLTISSRFVFHHLLRTHRVDFHEGILILNSHLAVASLSQDTLVPHVRVWVVLLRGIALSPFIHNIRWWPIRLSIKSLILIELILIDHLV